ncbi:MAG: polysaccharide biosynthesis tyrosine autokinase [Acidobacteriota bacterium]|nr:polysaccharide biosynthesis tyrosine autokinase [Acidobacteriota bacterium]
MKQKQDTRNNSLVERKSLQVTEATSVDYPQRVNGFHATSDDKAHLQEFLFALRKYWLLIAGVTILITALVGVYMARQPNVYEAAVRVQVDLENSSPTLGTTKGGTYVVNPVNDPAYFNTQLQILTSPRLLRRVVKDLDLEHDPGFRLQPNAAPSRLQQLFGQTASAGTSSVDLVAADADDDAELSREDLAEATRLAPYVEALKVGLKAEPVKEARLPIKETRLIDLTYSYSDPQLAAKIVNKVAHVFVVSNLERKTSSNQSTGNILQQRIVDLQTQIKEQENQLLEYAKNHQILSLDATQNTVVERLTNLNRQLLEAENERKVAEAAYQAALAPGAADALASGGAREPNDTEARLSQLLQRRSQLMVDFTAQWPEVKEIDNQIAALEKQLRQMRSHASTVVITNLSTHYRQGVARERALRGAFNQQRAETLAQNEAAVNYRILQQEIETNRGLLDGMLQRSKENEAALAAMRNNIHVSDYAVIPTVAVGPKRMLFTGVAFALALLLGIGLAVMFGYLDDSFRSTDDLERTLNLRALAAIPSTNGTLVSTPRASLSSNGNGNSQQELLHEPDDPLPFREAYRQLRTSMLLSARRSDFKTLLVTSSTPGEGRSMMAANTALSLSRTGALVLVIDADLRKPSQHKIFDLQNEQGLTTLLSEGFDQQDPLRYVQHSERRIGVLTAGPVYDDSAELLGTDQMREIVQSLRGIYDYVIIDSPPISYFTDAVLISSLVDRVVLVVDSYKSSRETVKRSNQLLQDAGAPTFGLVLSNVKEPRYNLRRYTTQTYAEA